MWIPVDTRLGDHPKVRSICRMTKCDRLKVVGALVTLWGLCADLETEELTYSNLAIEEEYGLPEGIVAAMVVVGWATSKGDSLLIHTRNGERDQAREARREIARKGGLARAAQQAAASSQQAAASRQQAGSRSATDRQRDIERKKQTGAAASPPALEGAGLSAAKAMREAMASLGAPPPAVRADPTQALLALKEAS